MAFGRIKRRYVFSRINGMTKGLNPKHSETKRRLLNWYGFKIGKGTRIYGKVEISGRLITDEDVFIGDNFTIRGNGCVHIEDRCDIAPDVVFLTGSHEIGTSERRAGKGITDDIFVGEGTWVGARSTILPGIRIGKGCVIAAGAVVTKDVPDHVVVGGVPAKIIRRLNDEIASS